MEENIKITEGEIDLAIEVHIEMHEFSGFYKREEIEDVYRFLYENISKSRKFKTVEKEEEAIVVIADGLYRHSISADPEINLASTIISLGNL